MSLKRLSSKQHAFFREYLANGQNAAAAYRKSYGGDPSTRVATAQGQRLLKHPLIVPQIKKLEDQAALAIQDAASRYVLSRTRVVDELVSIGFASMGDYMRPNADGDPVMDFESLTPRQQAALAEVTVETYVEGRGPLAREVKRVRFKLHPKTTALGMLNAMHGWDQPALDSPEGQIDVEKRAKVRAEMLTLLADMARPRPKLIEGTIDADGS